MPSKPKIDVKNIEDGLSTEEIRQLSPGQIFKHLNSKGYSMEHIAYAVILLCDRQDAIYNSHESSEDLAIELERIKAVRRLLKEALIYGLEDDQPTRSPELPLEPGLQPREFELPEPPKKINPAIEPGKPLPKPFWPSKNEPPRKDN